MHERTEFTKGSEVTVAETNMHAYAMFSYMTAMLLLFIDQALIAKHMLVALRHFLKLLGQVNTT